MTVEIWDEVARTIAKQSPCPRAKVGAVIFRADRKAVVSTGYNGQARKSDSILCGGSCCDRDRLGIPSGERIEIGCIHAEINAIANATYEGIALADACIVITAPPCLMCSKMIILDRRPHTPLLPIAYLQRARQVLFDLSIQYLNAIMPASISEQR